MQRVTLCTMIVVSAGCASSPHPAERTTDERVTISAPTGVVADMNLTRSQYVGGGVVPAARAEVWALLPAVYEELGLPAPAADRSSWTVAVQRHSIRRTLGRQRLSSFLECGRDMTGELADTHRITLSVRTWLENSGTASTAVHSMIEATATSVEGRAGSSTCSTRGELERRILEAVREHAER